jgi:hypothetical protein
LEIESFSLAARRRVRPVRAIQQLPTPSVQTEIVIDPLEETLKKNNEFLTELKRMTSDLREVVKGVNRGGRK